jgi:peptidoglycan/LPS O-acetylase OafA/YrhL
LQFLSAVTLFFVISGFTLTVVYGDAGALSSRDARRSFLWKRFARLGPIYYLSLLVALPQLLVRDDVARRRAPQVHSIAMRRRLIQSRRS